MNLAQFLPFIIELIKQRFKSKTYRLAAGVAVSPVLYETFPAIQELLTQNYSSIALLLAAIIAFIRERTTKPINEK